MLSDHNDGSVFNLGSGIPISIKSVFGIISKIIGKGTPQFGKILYRPDENMELYADIDLIQNKLKWKPRISFEEGIKDVIDWYRLHHGK